MGSDYVVERQTRRVSRDSREDGSREARSTYDAEGADDSVRLDGMMLEDRRGLGVACAQPQR